MGGKPEVILEVIYMGFIYLVTNKINGKQYVGKTKFDINTRWIQHKSEAKRLKPNVYFVRALNKYGCDNFTVKEIEQCSDDLLFEREKYYIKQYDTYNNGYNSTLGGEGNHKYETDDILSLWNDGFTTSEIADTIGSCVDTICLTLKANDVTTTEIRSRAQSKISQYKKKAILQYSLDGILLNKFSCIQEAVQQTGYSETSIRDVCNHHRHSSNGYIWCHEDEPKSIQQLIAEIPLEKTKHPVEQYTLDGTLIKKYNSINEAAQAIGVHRSSIEDAASGKSFNCQGYLWKYQDDEQDIIERVKRNNNKKDYAKIAVNQYDLQGNFIATYNSAAEAAIAVGKPGNGSSITKACKGKLKSAYKYRWAYAQA